MSTNSLMMKKVAVAAGAGLLLLGASACGSKDGAGATGSTNAEGQQPQQQGNGQSTRGGFPGADGKVAAVSGSTAQVQSQANGQVAVTWNGSTTFTKQASAALADVKVGTCVMVTPTTDSTSSGSDTAATTVAAARVTVTTKTDGSCTGGFGGGRGGQPPQLSQGGQLPEGGAPPADGTAPGGTGGGRQFRGSFGAFGEVTAVSADGFTVKSSRPSGTPSAGSTPTMTDTAITVTVSGSTTYAKTVAGAASDVKVGLCLRANGETDTTGAITAKTVALTDPTNGECGGMFVRSGNAPGAAGSSQES